MKKRRPKYLIITLVAILLIAAALVLYLVLRPKPVGGALYMPDLDDGFEVYVMDEYSSEMVRVERGWRIVNDPHTLWRITDENTKSRICELCQQIESIRQFVGNVDELIGGICTEVGPCIYIDAGDFGYSIRVQLREGYAPKTETQRVPAYPQIYDEIAEGTPLCRFCRMDMSLNAEGLAIYDYSKSYPPDFLDKNEEGTNGWYSTMPQNAYEELLALIDTLDHTTAEVVEAYE